MTAEPNDALTRHLLASLQEFGCKLKLPPMPMTLYYPAATLARLAGVTPDALPEALDRYAAAIAEPYGALSWHWEPDGRCALCLPAGLAEAAAHLPENPFLTALVELCGTPGATAEDAFRLFGRFGVPLRKTMPPGGEFDEMLWFASGEPDRFRYCFRREGGQLSYHRFEPEDLPEG